MPAVVGGDGFEVASGLGFLPDGAATSGGDGFDFSFTSGLIVPNTFLQTVSGGSQSGPVPQALDNGLEAGRVLVGGDGFGPFQATVGGITHWIGTNTHRGKVRLRDILVALRREILDTAIFADHQVYIRLDLAGQNENPPSLNDYLEIVPLNELSDQNTLSGGGVESDMRAEPVELRIFHHLGTDQHNRHTHWTLSQLRGAARKADELVSVVQLLDIVDESGTAILSEPMRVKGPTSFQVSRRGWGYAAVRVEITYTAELALIP